MAKFNLTRLAAAVLLLPAAAGNAASPKNPVHYRIEQVGQKKTEYAPGDTLTFRLSAIQADWICADGIEKTRIFAKGLRLLSQSAWHEASSGVWQKELSALVGSNPAKGIQLTAYRETDAGKVVETFTLKP